MRKYPKSSTTAHSSNANIHTHQPSLSQTLPPHTIRQHHNIPTICNILTASNHETKQKLIEILSRNAKYTFPTTPSLCTLDELKTQKQKKKDTERTTASHYRGLPAPLLCRWPSGGLYHALLCSALPYHSIQRVVTIERNGRHPQTQSTPYMYMTRKAGSLLHNTASLPRAGAAGFPHYSLFRIVRHVLPR
jgi:hypothetical protein